MGKMLETLKLSEGRRTTVGKPDAAPVQDTVTDWEIAEEVPFVEVGGPNKKVELSPGLVKHAPQPAPQPPHLPGEPAIKPMTIELSAARPMTVAYEAWPAPVAVPLRVSPEIIAYHQPEHAASQAYARLLQAMRGALKTSGAGVLLLVGLKPKVGASTVLLNLAVSAAIGQKLRVMALGGDCRRFGLSPAAGFTDVLDGTTAMEQAIVKTGIGELHLLSRARTPSQSMSTEAMAWLVGWLRERYDLVLIDGPSADDASLAVYLHHVNGAYLVLPRGAAAPTPAVRQLGGRLCGLIHTHFEV